MSSVPIVNNRITSNVLGYRNTNNFRYYNGEFQGWTGTEWSALGDTFVTFVTQFNYSQKDAVELCGHFPYILSLYSLVPTPIDLMKTSITPSSNTSKVLISVSVMGEFESGNDDADFENVMFYLERTVNHKIGPEVTYLRNTDNDSGTANYPMGIACPSMSYYHSNTDSTPELCRFMYVDEPQTTENVTYRVMFEGRGAQNFILNRTVKNTSEPSLYTYEAGLSTFIVHEMNQSYLEHIQTDFTGSLINMSSSTPTAITDLRVTVTPTSTSDKVKIAVSAFGEWNIAGPEYNHMFFLERQVDPSDPLPPVPVYLRSGASGSATKGIAPATTCYHVQAGTTGVQLYFEFVDEPSTTHDVQYTLMCETASASTFRLNSTYTTTGEYSERGVSTMVCQVIPSTTNFNYAQTDSVVSYFNDITKNPSMEIPVLTTTITPSSTVDKYIKITAHVVGEWSSFYSYNCMFLLEKVQDGVSTFLRNESCLNLRGPKGIAAMGTTYYNDATSTIDYSPLLFVDKVTSTSTITYKVWADMKVNDYIFKLNSTYSISSSNAYERGMSNIIVEEISAP